MTSVSLWMALSLTFTFTPSQSNTLVHGQCCQNWTRLSLRTAHQHQTPTFCLPLLIFSFSSYSWGPVHWHTEYYCFSKWYQCLRITKVLFKMQLIFRWSRLSTQTPGVGGVGGVSSRVCFELGSCVGKGRSERGHPHVMAELFGWGCYLPS